MDENRFWLALWLGMMGILGLTISVCVSIDSRNVQAFIDHGYTRGSLPGVGGITWVKPTGAN